jgi:hypothetical protein
VWRQASLAIPSKQAVAAAAPVLLTPHHAGADFATGQVVVTHLRADAVDVREVDWTRPTAIVLGNERAGERYSEVFVLINFDSIVMLVDEL